MRLDCSRVGTAKPNTNFDSRELLAKYGLGPGFVGPAGHGLEGPCGQSRNREWTHSPASHTRNTSVSRVAAAARQKKKGRVAPALVVRPVRSSLLGLSMPR